MVLWTGLNWHRKGQMAGDCADCSLESSAWVKWWEFLDCLRGWHLLRKDSAPWSSVCSVWTLLLAPRLLSLLLDFLKICGPLRDRRITCPRRGPLDSTLLYLPLAEGPPRTLACFMIKAHSSLLFAFCFHLFTLSSHKSFSTSTSHLILSLATFLLSNPCLIHFNHVPYHSNFSF